MACINMYNPDGGAGFGGGPQQPALGPRISFSSDFAVDPPPPAQNRAMGLRCQEEDLNFEFSSLGSRPMMAADQLFSKGRILPLKEGGGGGRPPTTLRDELRGGADDDGRAAKVSSRWREMLGLRKSLCVGGGAAKKSDKSSSIADDADMVTTDMAASNQDP